eukprot:985573-Rhodomonas_salina.1
MDIHSHGCAGISGMKGLHILLDIVLHAGPYICLPQSILHITHQTATVSSQDPGMSLRMKGK